MLRFRAYNKEFGVMGLHSWETVDSDYSVKIEKLMLWD